MMQVQPGVVAISPVIVDGTAVEVPLFITKRWVESDGSIVAEYTSLGTSDPQTSRKLTQVSKTLNLVHFCMTPDCQVPGNFLSHIQKVFLVRGDHMNVDLLGHSGQRRWCQLCSEHLGIDVTASLNPGASEERAEKDTEAPRRGALRRPAASIRKKRADEVGPELSLPALPRGGGGPGVSFSNEVQVIGDGESQGGEERREKKRQRREGGGLRPSLPRDPSEGMGEALGDLRKELADQMRRENEEVEEAGLRHTSKARASSSVVEGKSRSAPTKMSLSMAQPPAEVAGLLDASRGERKGDSMSGKKTKSPREELVAAAASASGDSVSAHGKKSKDKKKKRGKDSRIIQALRSAIAKKKKKKKKKKRSPTAGGEDPPGSSGGSDDSGDSDSDYSEEESYSDSSEEKLSRKFKAPLKRKAERRPGSVAELLLTQIAQQLQEIHVDREQLLTAGPRVTSYWQITLRPRHGAFAPAMRELFLLGSAIDKIRSGHLLAALDYLSGRFMAVESAISEGWTMARFLEVCTPEEEQVAPAELQLQARRHGQLIARAHGNEGKGKGSSGGRPWSPYAGGGTPWRWQKGDKEGKGKKGGKEKKGSKDGKRPKGGGKDGHKAEGDEEK